MTKSFNWIDFGRIVAVGVGICWIFVQRHRCAYKVVALQWHRTMKMKNPMLVSLLGYFLLLFFTLLQFVQYLIMRCVYVCVSLCVCVQVNKWMRGGYIGGRACIRTRCLCMCTIQDTGALIMPFSCRSTLGGLLCLIRRNVCIFIPHMFEIICNIDWNIHRQNIRS